MSKKLLTWLAKPKIVLAKGRNSRELIWPKEGLKGPGKQSERGGLWINEDSCVRHQSQHRTQAWVYDFVATRTHEGRLLHLLTIVDEHTRDCLAIGVTRALRADDVLRQLSELCLQYGRPKYIC